MRVLPNGVVASLHGQLFAAVCVGHIFCGDKKQISAATTDFNTISVANSGMGHLCRHTWT